MADTVDDSLHALVKSIVDELEAAASGSLYRVDGNWKVVDDLDRWKEAEYRKKADKFAETHDGTWDADLYDSFDEYMEDEIGTVDGVDEPETVSLLEYVGKQSLGDARFEVDSEMELLGGKVLFCYGGPNVWVADDEVRGYWGSSRVEMSLDSETRSELFSWFEERWNAARDRWTT